MENGKPTKSLNPKLLEDLYLTPRLLCGLLMRPLKGSPQTHQSIYDCTPSKATGLCTFLTSGFFSEAWTAHSNPIHVYLDTNIADILAGDPAPSASKDKRWADYPSRFADDLYYLCLGAIATRFVLFCASDANVIESAQMLRKVPKEKWDDTGYLKRFFSVIGPLTTLVAPEDLPMKNQWRGTVDPKTTFEAINQLPQKICKDDRFHLGEAVRCNCSTFVTEDKDIKKRSKLIGKNLRLNILNSLEFFDNLINFLSVVAVKILDEGKINTDAFDPATTWDKLFDKRIRGPAVVLPTYRDGHREAKEVNQTLPN